MSSETSLWDDINSGIGKLGHFSRIESPSTSPGYPDVDYCIRGYNNQMELKHSHDQRMPKIRPSQAIWFRKRVKAGGKPWLFAKVRNKEDKITYLLFKGSVVPEIASNRAIDFWFESAYAVFESRMNRDKWLIFAAMITEKEVTHP